MIRIPAYEIDIDDSTYCEDRVLRMSDGSESHDIPNVMIECAPDAKIFHVDIEGEEIIAFADDAEFSGFFLMLTIAA